MKNFFFFFSIILVFLSCQKDEEIIYTNNTIPEYDKIPEILIRNYVNRLFIDLIGREPKDDEMDSETAILKLSNLSQASREALVTKLQTDTTFIEGDSSYFHAYHNQLYVAGKARMLEGADNGAFGQVLGNINSNIVSDSISGDWVGYEINKAKRQRIYDVFNIPIEYRTGQIDITEVYARYLDNALYDIINMNSFNFINAAFDDLFFRYPTTNEFDESYEMVEYNSAGTLFGDYGQNKGDFISIATHSTEFYEGTIVWVYRSYLKRSPNTEETFSHLQELLQTKDLQHLQKEILITDEYANF